jgi:diguanylate cyclase (GGDEF)-like protein
MLSPSRLVNRQTVPPDIYVSLVDALFSDPRSLLVGALSTSCAALLTAWETSHLSLVACAFAILVIGSLRAASMHAYARWRPEAPQLAFFQRWERLYVAGAALYATALGAWCLVCFAVSNHAVVLLLCSLLTVASAAGVSGRNFARPQVVTLQLLGSCIPLCVGFILHGVIYQHLVYYAFLAAFAAPLFLAVKYMSSRLERTLVGALVASRDMSALASRFDTALNNMPHGLCMFDAEQRFVVANDRFIALLALDPTVQRDGAKALDILRECSAAGVIPPATIQSTAATMEARLRRGGGGQLPIDTPDGRLLEMTFQPMENGGSVVLVEDATERRNAEARINHLARFDSLTGLPNRSHFREQMERMIARSGPCAVLFIDLDEFKQVNDTLGHPSGDQLLCMVAERLRQIVRPFDLVGRFGGDEFVVLQNPTSSPEQAAALANRIIERLCETYEVEGHEVMIGASVGIALAPRDGADADVLLKNADMALYRAKAEGRRGWRFFETEMDVRARARRSLEIDLRNALASDAFILHYQPLVNLKTKRVSTCEALLRWPHPERGMVSPAEFIPVAEEMGLIVEIGTRVLHKACAECTNWPDNVRVAVNLSPLQFRRGNVVDAVRAALRSSGLRPNRLEVEITESVLLQQNEQTNATLRQLRDLGVRISLDDFGTGYSSLSYLHSFPLHKVKIDRSFLQDIGDSDRSLTLLRGVARLSAALGMSVAIEGVETNEQLAVIASESSVDEVQGFLFSRPKPPEEVRQLLYATPFFVGKVA